MRNDADVLAEVEAAFGDCERPEHFTNYKHCKECAEHDELLRDRDRSTLQISDVGNPGWDPICFCSPRAIAYYMPALARLALEAPTYAFGWYGSQLVFHLWSAGEQNPFYDYCNARQREAIASLLSHFIESRASLTDFHAEEILQAYEHWGA